MSCEILIDLIFEKFNFQSFPNEYKKVLMIAMKKINEELGEDLLSITLGGSGGKNKIIQGWSDLDIYVIVKKHNINKFKNIQKELECLPIHIGLTIYTIEEVENNFVDYKTKVMIYEKNNFNVNPTLYGNEYFQNVTLEDILKNDLLNYPQVLQMFRRMYVEVLNGNKKIDKTYVKKMLVLVKCILSCNNIFTYGYDEVYEKFMNISNNINIGSLQSAIMDLESNNDYILNLSSQIIEYTEQNNVFYNIDNFKNKKLRIVL